MKSHKFTFALIALLLMLLPPIGMYFAVKNPVPQNNGIPLIWGLLAIVVLGNVLALRVK
jgi:hypothetical protein